MKHNPLLDNLDGNGPVTKAKDLRHGDWVLMKTPEWHASRKYRVTHASTFLQVAEKEGYPADRIYNLSFESMDEKGFTHYGHDAPIWLTILTLGAYQIRKF